MLKISIIELRRDFKVKRGITTEELSYQFKDEKKVIEAYAAIGFDALDYSYDMYAYPGSPYALDSYLEYAKEIKKVADRNHIVFNQLHAPLYHHRVDIPMTETELKEEEFLKSMTLRSFEVANILGCKYIVMHPRKFKNYKTLEDHHKLREYNLNMFKEFIPYIKKYNIQIAIENMFVFDDKTHIPVDTSLRTAEEIVSYIDELGSEYFVACLDTGHANINGLNPCNMAKILGNRLKVLHIHDNFGQLDQHLICGLGTIDWNLFIKTLSDINFQGVFSLETCGMMYNMDPGIAEDCVRFEFQVINKLLNSIK